MSDVNAAPNEPAVDAPAPLSLDLSTIAPSVVSTGAPVDSSPASTEPVIDTSDAALADVIEAVEALPDPVVVSASQVTAVEQILALSEEVAKTLHDVFTYIHEGFDQHSLMIGMSRFYEIARAVKAKAEA